MINTGISKLACGEYVLAIIDESSESDIYKEYLNVLDDGFVGFIIP